MSPTAPVPAARESRIPSSMEGPMHEGARERFIRMTCRTHSTKVSGSAVSPDSSRQRGNWVSSRWVWALTRGGRRIRIAEVSTRDARSLAEYLAAGA